MEPLSSFIQKKQKLCFWIALGCLCLSLLTSGEKAPFVHFSSVVLFWGCILFVSISALPTVFAAFNSRRTVEQKEEEETSSSFQYAPFNPEVTDEYAHQGHH